MNHGPERSLDKMTTAELYAAFLAEVKMPEPDAGKIYKFLARDGLRIKKDGYCNVPMYFARINDKAACEVLEKYEVPLEHFICGAIIGNQFDLVEYYLKKVDFKEQVHYIAHYANLSGNTDRILKLLTPAQVTLFKKQSISIEENEKKLLEIQYSNASTENLTKKCPSLTIYILTIREEAALLLQYLEERNTLRLWQFAADHAARFSKFTLLNKILSRSPKLNNFEILKHIVLSGDRAQITTYLQKYDGALTQKHYMQLALCAADNGEFAIAEMMLPKIKIDSRTFSTLSLEARQAGFVYTADKLEMLGENEEISNEYFWGLAEEAIVEGNLERTMACAGQLPDDSIFLVELALAAAGKGELKIAVSLLNRIPAKNKFFKSCAESAQENGFTDVANYFINLDRISNQTIPVKPDFNNLTAHEIYDVFVEAVKREDHDCIVECIIRDGFEFRRHGLTVLDYFAKKDDRKSCELLAPLKMRQGSDFAIGAHMGVEKANPAAFEYDVFFSELTEDELLQKYPDYPLEIAISFGDKDKVLAFLISFNNDKQWQNAAISALKFNKKFLHTILEQGAASRVEFNYFVLTMYAIENSNRNAVTFLSKNVPPPFHPILAECAAANGEIVIAQDCLKGIEKPNYERLSQIALENEYVYAAEFFKNLHLSDLEKEKIEINATKASVETKTTELIESKAAILSKFIREKAEIILEQGSHSPEVQQLNEKIAFDDLNFLLDQVLIHLEKKGLLHLTRYRGHIFVSDNEPAYECLRKLTTARKVWLEYTNFFNARARLLAKAGAQITLAQFCEFYNELCAKLQERPATKTSPGISRRVTAVAGENTPNFIETSAPASPSSTSSSSKKRYYDPAPNHKPNLTVIFNAEKEKQKNKKNHPNKKGKTNKVNIANKSLQAVAKQNVKKVNTSSETEKLPTLGTFIPNVKVANSNIEALQRQSDNVPKGQKPLKPELASIYIGLLDDMMQCLNETQKAILGIDADNALLIHDLAMLDLIFKINRDLNDEPFATELIHGVHLYLLKDSPTFVSISSLVGECTSFGRDQFVNHYSITREKYNFTKLIRTYDNVQTSPEARLELIKSLFKLQRLCYQLWQNEDSNTSKIGRYALSGIIMVIGEQMARLKDTEINNQLRQMPIFKVLNEYRVYRGIRHGIEQEKEANGNFFIEIHEDWEKQMDGILANFMQRYFLDEYLQNLEIVEIQGRMKKLKI